MKLDEYREKSLALAEKRVVAEERKAAALETIARSIEDEEGVVIQTLLQHATVMKRDVAFALNGIGAAIVGLDNTISRRGDE